MKLLLQNLPGRQLGKVLCYTDGTLFKLQQFHCFMFLAGTENKPDRRFFPCLPFVFIQPAQLEFHLPLVGWFELAKLKFDGHQPFKSAVKKEQIKIIIVVIHLDTFLAGNERKTSPKFE